MSETYPISFLLIHLVCLNEYKGEKIVFVQPKLDFENACKHISLPKL